jgi:uncharacterized protein
VRLSQFTVFVPDFPSDGKHVVYNTFNQATAVIGERAKSVLNSLVTSHQSPVARGDDEKKYIDTFTGLGFVVGDSVDEGKEFRDWYEKSRYSKSTMRATILTTYDCNFACEYCVEEGVKNPVKMDQEHCQATVDWLIKRVDKYQSDDIRLQFYGGEPLMNVLPIHYVASEINDYSERNGTSFSFTITTNGSLLNAELVDRLIPLGLESIKVTLDGDKEAHNSKRPFRSGKGSFDVIIENILQVADRVKIKIGTNVDDANLESVPRLLDYLEQIGLRDKIDSIKFNPIVRISDASRVTSGGWQVKGETRGLAGSERSLCPPVATWTLDNLIWLTWDAYRRGFKTENTIQSTICSMNLDGTAVVMDPLGRIYTCPAFVGREGFQAGDIYHQELFARHREFMSMEVPDDCFNCAYMPMCGGGCRHVAYMRYGDLSRTVCERDYLQKVTAESLKMHVLSQRGPSGG